LQEFTTVQLVSNGVNFYWLRSVKANRKAEELTHSGHVVFLDVFKIDPGTFEVGITQPRLVLAKQPVDTLKIIEYLQASCFITLIIFVNSVLM
jgi:hypothetical protein